jgi:hypothetical protein
MQFYYLDSYVIMKTRKVPLLLPFSLRSDASVEGTALTALHIIECNTSGLLRLINSHSVDKTKQCDGR